MGKRFGDSTPLKRDAWWIAGGVGSAVHEWTLNGGVYEPLCLAYVMWRRFGPFNRRYPLAYRRMYTFLITWDRYYLGWVLVGPNVSWAQCCLDSALFYAQEYGICQKGMFNVGLVTSDETITGRNAGRGGCDRGDGMWCG
jgi:hypothetical protein